MPQGEPVRYADPLACPACRGVIGGQRRCPHCGLDLSAPQVTQIWRHLTEVDRLVAEVRTRPAPPMSVTSPASSPLAPPMPRPAPPAASAVPAGRPGGGLTTGSVLLGLGAAFLVVAGTIFVSFAWSVVGVGGRAAILALITAATAGATVWALRRRLRGSAEALGALTAGLTLADLMAAWSAGLLGLGGAPAWVVWALLTVLLLGFSLAIVPVGRRHLGADLVSVQVAAGVALLPTVITVTQQIVDLGGRLFWSLLVAALVGAVVVLVGLLGRQRLTTLVALVVTGTILLVAAAVAILEATSHPELARLAGELHGLPLLVMILAAALATAWQPVRSTAVAIAVVLAVLLVSLPLGADVAAEAAYLWGAAVVVAVAVVTGRGPVPLGLRLAAAPVAAVVAATSAAWWPRVAESWVSGWDDPLAHGMLNRTEPVVEAPAAGWVVLLGVGALALGTFLVSRWVMVRPRAERRHLHGVAALLVTGGALSALCSAEVPVVAVAGLVLAAGVAGLAVARTCPRAWDVAPVVLMVLAPTAVIASRDALTLLAVAAAVALAAASFAVRPPELRAAAATFSTGWALMALTVVVTRPGIGLAVEWQVTVVLAVAVAVAVVAAFLRRWPPVVGVEVAGAGGAALALALGSPLVALGWQAAWWTLLGLGALVVGLLVPARHLHRLVAAVALGIAWVLRLVASDVEVVEAYTAPFALVALAAGAWAMRRDPTLGTARALGAGLTLALLPSLPQALGDPVSWRALVLGLVALLALAVGVWRHWQAPFVGGATILALLVVVELGPFALAVPRWIMIGLVGLVLLLGGITWEDRARDGRAAARFVRSMR